MNGMAGMSTMILLGTETGIYSTHRNATQQHHHAHHEPCFVLILFFHTALRMVCVLLPGLLTAVRCYSADAVVVRP